MVTKKEGAPKGVTVEENIIRSDTDEMINNPDIMVIGVVTLMCTL
jgi:hypothetical protein